MRGYSVVRFIVAWSTAVLQVTLACEVENGQTRHASVAVARAAPRSWKRRWIRAFRRTEAAAAITHDPYRYLKDVLERLPTQLASRIEELLPQPTGSRRIVAAIKRHRHRDSLHDEGAPALRSAPRHHYDLRHGKNSSACPFNRWNRTTVPRHAPFVKSKATTSS